jgi:hypothetical protein
VHQTRAKLLLPRSPPHHSIAVPHKLLLDAKLKVILLLVSPSHLLAHHFHCNSSSKDNNKHQPDRVMGANPQLVLS